MRDKGLRLRKLWREGGEAHIVNRGGGKERGRREEVSIICREDLCSD